MTAYKDVEAINRFISSTPWDWGIYIHLDKKSTIRREEIDKRAFVFSINKVYWGAWEHLYVILWLLNKAEDEGNFDYYHIVSGQDFYAMSPDKINETLVSLEGNNLIDYFPIPHPTWNCWDFGYGIFQNTTLASYCDIRNGWAWRFNNILLKIQQLCPYLKRKLPDMELFGAGVYCSLHNDFVSWLLKSDKAIRFLNSLKNTTCSEEVFFATLIINSPYKNKCIQNSYRYVDWGKSGLVLDESDFAKIVESNSFFCRKVDSRRSGNLSKLLLTYISQY